MGKDEEAPTTAPPSEEYAPDWNQLIPELKDCDYGEGISAEEWVARTGNFQLAVAYTTVFWPRFVEHDGMVLREGFCEDFLREWIQHYGEDRSAVERMVNHVHIRDLHCGGPADATPARIVHIGRTLKEIYECKLRCQFPGKDIVVEFDDGPYDDTVDYVLTFFLRRKV